MIIIRYGEIGLKSSQTRERMEAQLIKNIKKATPQKRIKKEKGRIFLESHQPEDAEAVSRVFGVVSTSLALKTTSSSEDILREGVKKAKSALKGKKTFAVRARRTGSHDYTSPEIAGRLGAEILKEQDLKVDLNNPEGTIYVEIRNKDAYIYDAVIPGVGGLPLGTQGNGIALVSGGIDSPVAAWMMMKRGIEITVLFLDCRPLVDDRTIKRALKTIAILSEWANQPIRTYIAPYGEALMEFLKYGDNKLGCVLCKRLMFQVAAKISEEEKAKAIITGESLGQVASQTIHNIFAIEKDIEIPVFQPLIGMDKTEIIDRARKIGTYRASTEPANCCLGPPLYPETKASPMKVGEAERILNMDKLVDDVLKNLRVEEISLNEQE